MRRVILTALSCALCAAVPHIAFAQDETVAIRKIVNRVQPQYPALARSFHISGTAKLFVHVGRDGKVSSVTVLGGHPLLAQAAVVAVSEWKWEPSSNPTEETVEVKFLLP